MLFRPPDYCVGQILHFVTVACRSPLVIFATEKILVLHGSFETVFLLMLFLDWVKKFVKIISSNHIEFLFKWTNQKTIWRQTSETYFLL